MPATFQGTSFFLTYPQSTFDFDVHYEQFTAHLSSLGSTKYTCVGIEQHESGEPHWHALVLFETKRRLSERSFDIFDRHPHVKPVGRKREDWNRVEAYVKKDGNYRESGQPRHACNSVWAQVAAAESRESALSLILEHKPRDFVIQRRNIDYALDLMFPVRRTEAFSPRPLEAFSVPEDLLQWMHESM